MIAKDSSDKYLVYRYGSDSLIELEFPKDKINSWKKFKYSWYSRGGGIENLAMDMNFLFFDIKPYRYIVYKTYTAENGETYCGIKIYKIDGEFVTDINGDLSTVRGSLGFFRWNALVVESDEFY